MAEPNRTQPLLPEEVYRHALSVGRRAAGVSGPNPPVGCVIVRDGRVVADGATGPVGEAHAEVAALQEAGGAAAGATAVVTLEPCAHHGRTPPCTEALREAGVRAVHVLLRDPDPVAAGGLAALTDAGIDVLDVGSLRPDLRAVAVDDLRGFLTRVRHGRPHVTLKLAQTVDGGTVPAPGGYLTGPAARAHVHRLRATVDAVLVGGRTVRTDDPRLDVRHVVAEQVVAAGVDARPRPVLVSTTGDVPPTARAVRAGALLVVGPDADPVRLAEFAERGATVVPLPGGPSGELDPGAVVRSLLDHRILTVLAEPGPRLAQALLAVDVVDVVELHVAGGAAVGPGRIRPAIDLLEGVVRAGSDVAASRTDDGDLVLRRTRHDVAAEAELQGVA